MKITPLFLVSAVPLGLSAQIVQVVVDFGPNTSASTHYNFITKDSGTWNLANLVNVDGSSTGAALSFFLDTGISGIGDKGSEGINGPLVQDSYAWENLATDDLLYTTSLTNKMEMSMSGLTPGETYEFAFLGCRNAYSTYRPTEYSVTMGGETVSGWVNTTHNEDPPVIISLLSTADESGIASITVGAHSSASYGQYHINLLQVAPTSISAIPEPSMLALVLGLSVFPGWRRRRSRPRKPTQSFE